MQRFTNAELADIHLTYGATDGNGRAAQRLYRERFPNRVIPNRQTFERVHRQLRDSGSFNASRHDVGRPRSARTVRVEEDVLREVEHNPSTSTRAVSRRLGVRQSLVWEILHDEGMHPYRFQRVQALMQTDFPLRVDFSRWYLQQAAVQPDFPSYVLFTDEATFTREGVFNSHNAHVWEYDNPHATRPHAYQQRFSVNVWAGMVHEYVIGPYILPHHLDGPTYLIFLQQVLPELLAVVPQCIRRRIWFQHDGAPAHFSRDVRDYLDATYPHQWIGRGGPVPWPPRSPDLSCLDFFLWGHLKSIVYDTPVDSDVDLVARLVVAAGDVQDMPDVYANVRRSMLRRCTACITVGGRSFEHLL